jgi:hypothetical protein
VAVNSWLIGVIDFATALSDPANRELNPKYDSRDHLHPSTVGHGAMENAVDLALFR